VKIKILLEMLSKHKEKINITEGEMVKTSNADFYQANVW